MHTQVTTLVSAAFGNQVVNAGVVDTYTPPGVTKKVNLFGKFAM